MKKFIFLLLCGKRGAMDSILVTLLLVVMGVGLVVGLFAYFDEQKVIVETSASSKTQQVLNEAGQ